LTLDAVLTWDWAKHRLWPWTWPRLDLLKVNVDTDNSALSRCPQHRIANGCNFFYQFWKYVEKRWINLKIRIWIWKCKHAWFIHTNRQSTCSNFKLKKTKTRAFWELKKRRKNIEKNLKEFKETQVVHFVNTTSSVCLCYPRVSAFYRRECPQFQGLKSYRKLWSLRSFLS
jgi:hypothetical protein